MDIFKANEIMEGLIIKMQEKEPQNTFGQTITQLEERTVLVKSILDLGNLVFNLTQSLPDSPHSKSARILTEEIFGTAMRILYRDTNIPIPYSKAIGYMLRYRDLLLIYDNLPNQT